MDNVEYANSFNADIETTQRVIEVLNKYGDNKWWFSEDPKVIGYYQLNEPLLVIDFSKFHEGVEKLLNRPVFTLEFGVNYDGLKREAEDAWNGIQRTEKEKQEIFIEGLNKLNEVMQDKVIGVVVK